MKKCYDKKVLKELLKNFKNSKNFNTIAITPDGVYNHSYKFNIKDDYLYLSYDKCASYNKHGNEHLPVINNFENVKFLYKDNKIYATNILTFMDLINFIGRYRRYIVKNSYEIINDFMKSNDYKSVLCINNKKTMCTKPKYRTDFSLILHSAEFNNIFNILNVNNTIDNNEDEFYYDIYKNEFHININNEQNRALLEVYNNL